MKEKKLEKENTDEVKEEIVSKDTPVSTKENSELIKRAFRNDSSRLPALGELAFTDDAIKKADEMVKSGLLPDSVKNGQAALIIMQKGKEMGFTPMGSFEHVIVINGKPSLDGAAVATLLRRGNVEWEVVKNAEKEYKGEGANKKLIDVITEIKFFRRSLIDPSKILTHTSIFTYKDATAADLIGKDVWKKYLKSMLFWRCLSIGARQFAPDLLVGMVTAEELDTEGTIFFDAEGKIMEIKNKQ
jgi:hypothetical protein